jgi:hypothetical protein
MISGIAGRSIVSEKNTVKRVQLRIISVSHAERLMVCSRGFSSTISHQSNILEITTVYSIVIINYKNGQVSFCILDFYLVI